MTNKWLLIHIFIYNKHFYKKNVALPPEKKKQGRCHITPQPPHNGHLSTTATFLCPQDDHCREVLMFYWWNFDHDFTSLVLFRL